MKIIKYTQFILFAAFALLFGLMPLSQAMATDLTAPELAIEEASNKLKIKMQDPSFTKDFKQINKYCGEAPFSAGMPDDSPGRTGIWLGWKIVTAFMKNNKEITIEQLMMNNNAKQILNSSRYKPKK